MIKNYLLDTNILLQNPNSIFGFDDNKVWLCGTTLQELDGKKTAGGEIGYNARECVRVLDKLRESGDLIKGVKIGKGTLLVEPDGVSADNLPNGFNITIPDNRIISTCAHLNKRLKSKVILVTNDISMRVNASICGINVEGYRNDQVEDSGYKGHCDLACTEGDIDELYASGKIELTDCDLIENEFVRMKVGQKSALGVYRKGAVELIDTKKLTLFGGIKPKNYMQSFMIWALLQPADELPLVILNGPAGTAKTFLSLAAGLHQTYVSQRRYEGDYNRIIISRPSADSYSEFGFLPGDLKRKTEPLLASFYDNAEIILSGKGKDSYKEGKSMSGMQIDELLDSGIVEICALSFIRGRSLMNSYLIADECQNASKTLIRDIITRAGEGTKVICGDPNQIDAPALDKRTCGLAYAYSRMIGDPLSCCLTLDAENSVRSKLAKSAIKRL